MERRDFLKLAGTAAGAAATEWALGPSIRPAFAEGNKGHEIFTGDSNVWHLPYLPASEAESRAHVQTVPHYENGQEAWDRFVTTRVFNPAFLNQKVDPNNRYQAQALAVEAYAHKKGWVKPNESYLAFEQVFSYPATIKAENEILNQGQDVKEWHNGQQVDVDSIQPSSYSVAVAPITETNMVSYSNPGETGIIRSRLIAGQTQGKVAIAFAMNQHEDTLSPKDGSAVPAVHIDGYADAPVRIKILFPNANTEATFGKDRDEVVIEANLSKAGDLSVHLPKNPNLYKGNYSPVVLVEVANFASNDNGETEVEFRIGSDDFSPGKNRVTEADMLALRK
jgi:hypothetical protein